ncbi:hypothetical protein WCL83_004931, partial [Salmonella enterica subsp. diarizonae serovar 47:i:z53]
LPVSPDVRTCALTPKNSRNPRTTGLQRNTNLTQYLPHSPTITALSTSTPAGVYPAQDFNTRPGLSLSPEQVAIAASR